MEKVLLMEFLSKIDKYFTPNLSQPKIRNYHPIHD